MGKTRLQQTRNNSDVPYRRMPMRTMHREHPQTRPRQTTPRPIPLWLKTELPQRAATKTK